jgi:hypothetical protein
MKRLPLLLDAHPSALVRAGIYFLVPIVLVLSLPLILLVILVLYLAALFHGGRILVFVLTGQKGTPEYDFQRPHFLEMPVSDQATSDKSQAPPS